PGVDVLARLPRSHLPESVVSYRERFINNGDETDLGFAPGPDLSNRSVLANVAQMRGERGVESIGELLLLADLPSQGGEILYGNVGPDYFIDEDAWRIDFPSAGFTDFATAPSQEPFSEDENFNERFFGAMLSVDRDLPNGACCLGGGFCQNWTRDECESAGGVFDGPYTWCDFPNLVNCTDGNVSDVQFDEDGVSGDAEEANLLFAGASNLITTRSDVFTVYFRVRGFRQNADTGRWDATDLSSIVSDTRYVMVVDRSGVNRPGDPPKILLLDKLPD
ncbi:MAG: hypothetical protein GY715_03790, partial [Planctomycetes bacterium]|nr:hypothetical protein [Planctomycetota bacterium]